MKVKMARRSKIRKSCDSRRVETMEEGAMEKWR
jgi:hypothetical protein